VSYAAENSSVFRHCASEVLTVVAIGARDEI